MRTQDTKTPQVKLSSTVFPSDEDKATWAKLSDEERLAAIEASEQEGFESGIADKTSALELISETRAES